MCDKQISKHSTTYSSLKDKSREKKSLGAFLELCEVAQ